MEANDRQSIFRSLVVPKFIYNRPEDGPGEGNSKERSKSPVDPYTRRRQQVRRAQKNHRQKKENYVSALEGEVKRLRHLVAQQQSLGDIQMENESLREILAAHGFAVPPSRVKGNLNASPACNSDPGFIQISLVGGSKSGKHLQPSIPRSRQSNPYPSFPPAGEGTAPSSTPAEPGCCPDHDLALSSRARSGSIDINLEAFEFVMRLEQPCLDHVHAQGDTPETPGHVLTLQSASLAYAPRDSTPGTSWNVPVAEMQRLLDLSAMLPLTGELTPVQAWSHLMSHPGSSVVSRETLHGLTMRLIQEIRCYGFGSVIDEETFRTVLDSFLHFD